MGRFGEQLREHVLIGLDSCIFIYHFEANPRYLPLTDEVLRGVQEHQWTAVTSAVTVMEVTVRPWQLNQPAIAREYEALLAHFPHLTIGDVTRDVARQAARLRAVHRLRPADALQIATCLVHGATAYLTNDLALKRVSQEVAIILLDEFVED